MFGRIRSNYMKKSNLSLVVIRRRKHFIIVPLMVLIFMSCVTVKSWDGFPDLAEKYSVKNPAHNTKVVPIIDLPVDSIVFSMGFPSPFFSSSCLYRARK